MNPLQLLQGNRPTTLVMFSGGLDSTAMLVKLLTDTTDQLRVHHVRMVNRQDRADAEQAAVERIVPWCLDRYRPFRYSESALDFAALVAIPIDYMAIAYVACQVAIDTPGCTRIAVGTLASDTDEARRSAHQRRVFDTMYECYRARKLGEEEVEWIYPIRPFGKAGIVSLLPPELLEFSWSCRTPIRTFSGFAACGFSKACRVRAGVVLGSSHAGFRSEDAYYQARRAFKQ